MSSLTKSRDISKGSSIGGQGMALLNKLGNEERPSNMLGSELRNLNAKAAKPSINQTPQQSFNQRLSHMPTTSTTTTKAGAAANRGTSKLYDFKNIDLRQSRLTKNKQKIRETLKSTALRTQKFSKGQFSKASTFRVINDA